MCLVFPQQVCQQIAPSTYHTYILPNQVSVAMANSLTCTLLSTVGQPVEFHTTVAWVYTQRIVAQMASIAS